MLTAESITEVFPHARFHPEWQLVTWFPSGDLDNAGADRVVEFLESEEQLEGASFHRFTDMTGFSRIKISLDHVVRLARRRKQFYKGPPVRSALYTVRLLTLSVARMYQELMEGARIQVCTFRERAAAADWLGVPESVLKRPKGS
jgi:hypothetical protein